MFPKSHYPLRKMEILGFCSSIAASCRVALHAVTELGQACAPVVRGALRGGAQLVRCHLALARDEQEALSGHAQLAGLVACSASVAQCFASPGPALLVKICGALVVAGIAVSVAFRVARRHVSSPSWTHQKDLLKWTVRETLPRHGGSWAALALSLACEPKELWSPHLRSGVLDRFGIGSVVRSMRSRLPGVRTALTLVDAVNLKVRTELFVRDFEATATALCISGTARGLQGLAHERTG